MSRTAHPIGAWPADKVERWPTRRLIPNARNARTHSEAQVDQIAASIREWGWTNPVLVAEDGTIIAGHGRVLAARKLGLTEVPVMVAIGWTKAQMQAYAIADNKLALERRLGRGAAGAGDRRAAGGRVRPRPDRLHATRRSLALGSGRQRRPDRSGRGAGACPAIPSRPPGDCLAARPPSSAVRRQHARRRCQPRCSATCSRI